MFSPLTKQLIDALRGLPSVGHRSAQRMAFHLLSQENRETGKVLVDALAAAINQIRLCSECRHFTEQARCDICLNQKRNPRVLCVVESPADVVAIEQTNSYHGRYFVLHGHLSPLDGIGPHQIGIPQLLAHLKTLTECEEVILATNATVEGKATAHYIASQVQSSKIRCSRIAHGVPMGGELEYLDGGTLSHAFQSRLPLSQH
jgi:recombination protein RecR